VRQCGWLTPGQVAVQITARGYDVCISELIAARRQRRPFVKDGLARTCRSRHSLARSRLMRKATFLTTHHTSSNRVSEGHRVPWLEVPASPGTRSETQRARAQTSPAAVCHRSLVCARSSTLYSINLLYKLPAHGPVISTDARSFGRTG